MTDVWRLSAVNVSVSSAGSWSEIGIHAAMVASTDALLYKHSHVGAVVDHVTQGNDAY